MKINIIIPGFLVAVVLTSCSPYSANAPIGDREEGVCDYVRQRVVDGSMPLDLAQEYYGHCAPFEEPQL